MSRVCPALLFLCYPALAADLTRWLGPNREGKFAETGLLKSWPEGGPKSVWKVKGLGEGYSSMAVAGNRIYTQGQEGEQQFVLALDIDNGKQVWKTPTGKAFQVAQGGGPRTMPQVDGARLYALASDGTLVCLEAETGKRVWGFNYVERFGSAMPRWGFSEHPLIDGDRLIINPGGRGAGIVALNKATGAVLWQSQHDRAGYSSVLPVDFGGAHIYTVLTATAAIGVDARDGSLLWRYEKVANRVANIATPVYADGYVFYSSDYNTGCALLKLASEGGKVTATEVYFNRDMQNHYTTSIKIGEYLYGFSGNQPGILTAMEFKTGKVAWKDRSVEKGNCVLAENLLYCQGENGKFGLIDPSPAGYKEISRFQMPSGGLQVQAPNGNVWTVPAIANGRLYLRDEDNLYAYDIKR
ncbi:MAG: PQQ-binding-like beta-propeller repeat protein [Acidobacteria bacterium]|nr:PQQ-binding-like beta-propeller repeat protein [Acidobacteriota bacterium]